MLGREPLIYMRRKKKSDGQSGDKGLLGKVPYLVTNWNYLVAKGDVPQYIYQGQNYYQGPIPTTKLRHIFYFNEIPIGPALTEYQRWNKWIDSTDTYYHHLMGTSVIRTSQDSGGFTRAQYNIYNDGRKDYVHYFLYLDPLDYSFALWWANLMEIPVELATGPYYQELNKCRFATDAPFVKADLPTTSDPHKLLKYCYYYARIIQAGVYQGNLIRRVKSTRYGYDLSHIDFSDGTSTDVYLHIDSNYHIEPVGTSAVSKLITLDPSAPVLDDRSSYILTDIELTRRELISLEAYNSYVGEDVPQFGNDIVIA